LDIDIRAPLQKVRIAEAQVKSSGPELYHSLKKSKVVKNNNFSEIKDKIIYWSLDDVPISNGGILVRCSNINLSILSFK
jgi:hypothetical protein